MTHNKRHDCPGCKCPERTWHMSTDRLLDIEPVGPLCKVYHGDAHGITTILGNVTCDLCLLKLSALVAKRGAALDKERMP